jgi:stage V sporulation protein S
MTMEREVNGGNDHSNESQPRSTAPQEVFKISSQSQPRLTAGAIAKVIREGRAVEMQAIGAGATNQAVKAIIIARSYLQEEQITIAMTPSFLDVVIDGEERTALRMVVERR